MADRDPKLEPMPGEVFRTGSGTMCRVVDRFVSVGKKPGSNNPGYYIEVQMAGEQVKYVTNSRGVFRNKIRKAVIVTQSKSRQVDWENVDRHPHATVCGDMKHKHGHASTL